MRYNIGRELLRAIQLFYRVNQACVRINEKLSRWFPISRGVWQGCVMSPWLFNIYMDGIMREAMDSRGNADVKHKGTGVNVCRRFCTGN